MADVNPPPMPHVSPPKLSAMAVVALVLGILGLCTCGVTALFGLIFGIIALVKVKNSGGMLKGDGLAIAGIAVSGCFLIMLPVFAAMLLPALAAAKQRAQTIHCVSNEKQLALAIRIYCGDNTNHFPPAATWCDAIQSKVTANVFRDPAANSASRCDYGFNAALDGLDESKVDPKTVMLFESDAGWNANGGSDLMVTQARHPYGRIFVVAFADGSVQELRQSQLSGLRWNP